MKNDKDKSIEQRKMLRDDEVVELSTPSNAPVEADGCLDWENCIEKNFGCHGKECIFYTDAAELEYMDARTDRERVADAKIKSTTTTTAEADGKTQDGTAEASPCRCCGLADCVCKDRDFDECVCERDRNCIIDLIARRRQLERKIAREAEPASPPPPRAAQLAAMTVLQHQIIDWGIEADHCEDAGLTKEYEQDLRKRIEKLGQVADWLEKGLE